MPKLLNYDDTRVTPYTETILVNSSATQKLRYIPKDDSLSIIGFSKGAGKLGLTTNQFFIDYAPESYYFQADGMLYLSPADIGRTIDITYVPVASRIDADDLNPVLLWFDSYGNNVAYKGDFANPNGNAHVDWSNLLNIPGLATETLDGFMSYEDKRKIKNIDPNAKPFGSVLVGGMQYTPSQWGGALPVYDSTSITAVLSDKGLSFEVNPKTKGLVGDAALAALSGTFGAPSSTNRYVTEDDPRVIAAGNLDKYKPEIKDIVGLSNILASKSDAGHQHTVSDIKDFPAEMQKKADVKHAHDITDINNLANTLSGMAADYDNQILQLSNIVNGAVAGMANHKHVAADITDLRTFVENVVSGNPDDKASVDPYTQLDKVANMSGILNDFNVSGLQTTVGGGLISISEGLQYCGGVLAHIPATSIPIAQHDGGTVMASNVCKEALHVVGYADASLGARTFTITVTNANRNVGMPLDLAVSVTDSLGVMSYNATFPESTYTADDSRLYLAFGKTLKARLPFKKNTQYSVGDTWKITIAAVPASTIIMLSGDTGKLLINPNPADTMYANKGGVATIANGTTVTDNRPVPSSILKATTTAADVTSPTDSSGKLANTKFVQAAIPASPTVVTLVNTVNTLNTALTALTARVKTLEGNVK